MSKKKYIYIAIIAILSILFFNKNFRNIIKGYREIKHLKNNIAELEIKKIKFKERIKLLKVDDSYIEKIARKELGFSKKNEIIYKFVKNTD